MAHFAAGQRALDDKIYDQAIREFFIILEESKTSDEEKYEPLRNAVSHKKLDRPNTVKNLNHNFGLHHNVGDHFDITDPRIQELLKDEAKNLREIVIRYVESKINV